MTDKEFEEQKQRVLSIFNPWKSLLNLDSHRFIIYYDRSYCEDPHTVASVHANWEYMNHGIRFYMPKVAEIEDNDSLEESIVHELVHVLINPISCLLEDDKATNKANEFVTTKVAFALIWARDHKKEA